VMLIDDMDIRMALLRCCRSKRASSGFAGNWFRSEGWRKVVECDADSITDWQVGRDRGVGAAQVLHEGMAGRGGARRRQGFESAQRAQPRLHPTMSASMQLFAARSVICRAAGASSSPICG